MSGKRDVDTAGIKVRRSERWSLENAARTARRLVARHRRETGTATKMLRIDFDGVGEPVLWFYAEGDAAADLGAAFDEVKHRRAAPGETE